MGEASTMLACMSSSRPHTKRPRDHGPWRWPALTCRLYYLSAQFGEARERKKKGTRVARRGCACDCAYTCAVPMLHYKVLPSSSSSLQIQVETEERGREKRRGKEKRERERGRSTVSLTDQTRSPSITAIRNTYLHDYHRNVALQIAARHRDRGKMEWRREVEEWMGGG